MCLLASVGLQAQTIKGRVMEETENGEVALPGANVYWVGTSKGSVSDANGEFKIKWEKVGKLVVSFIGYRSDTIEVKSTDKFVTCTLIEKRAGEQAQARGLRAGPQRNRGRCRPHCL